MYECMYVCCVCTCCRPYRSRYGSERTRISSSKLNQPKRGSYSPRLSQSPPCLVFFVLFNTGRPDVSSAGSVGTVLAWHRGIALTQQTKAVKKRHLEPALDTIAPVVVTSTIIAFFTISGNM